MTTPAAQLDTTMEAASQALARMDYLACERHCLEALALARQSQDWAYYARILMPLQEARRQRRMIAAEGVVRLGTAGLTTDPLEWLAHLRPGPGADAAGCIVLTHPHDAGDARRLAQAVRRDGLCVEILLADNPLTAAQWTLRAYGDQGPDVNCTRPAPPAQWLDHWFVPQDVRWASDQPGVVRGLDGRPIDACQSVVRPVDWFLDSAESLGDAALAQVQAPLGGPDRVDALEHCLEVVTDHEKLHQALEEAAQAAARHITGRPDPAKEP